MFELDISITDDNFSVVEKVDAINVVGWEVNGNDSVYKKLLCALKDEYLLDERLNVYIAKHFGHIDKDYSFDDNFEEFLNEFSNVECRDKAMSMLRDIFYYEDDHLEFFVEENGYCFIGITVTLEDIEDLYKIYEMLEVIYDYDANIFCEILGEPTIVTYHSCF